MIEFQFRVSKAVTIWSEIAVRDKSRGGRAQRGDGRRGLHVHSSTRRHPAARGHVAGHHRRPRPRQRRLHLSRRPRAAQRQHHDRVLRRGDLFGRGDHRHLRVLVVPDAALAACPRSHRPGLVVSGHAARFGDDHRDVGLAQRHRARRRGCARAAPCEYVAEPTAATSTGRTATRFRRRASCRTSRWRRRVSASSRKARRPVRSPAPPVPARWCSS